MKKISLQQTDTSVNKNKNSFFKPNDDQDAANRLLSYVLQSNVAEVVKMVSERPQLLFIEATAEEWASGFIKKTDEPVHRVVQLSPLQAMFAAGDTQLIDSIRPELTCYKDNKNGTRGFALAYEQLTLQFPNGLEYPKSCYDFESLMNVIIEDEQLIETGEPSPSTITAIEQFRKDFLPGVVKNGHLFNIKELLKALSIYARYATSYHSHHHLDAIQNEPPLKSEQLDIFWREVVGYLERLIPAVYAKYICNGTKRKHDNVVYTRLLNETMLLNHESINSTKMTYFPLDTDPDGRLGLDFGVCIDTNDAISKSSSLDDGAWETLDQLTKLISDVSDKIEGVYNSFARAVEIDNSIVMRK